MSFFEIIRIALLDISLRKFRSALAALGIIFGVASVLAMISISEGAKQAEIARYSALGVDNIIIHSVKPPDNDQKNKEQNQSVIQYGLLRRDLGHILKTFPKIRYAIGIRNLRRTLFTSTAKKLDLTVLATEPEYLPAIRGKLAQGRFLCDIDQREFKRVCVLGSQASRKLFKFHEPLNESVRIDEQLYRCVGVLQPLASQMGGGYDLNNCLFIPLSTAQNRYGDQSTTQEAGKRESVIVQLDAILLQVTEENYVTPTARRLENYLKKRHENRDYELFVPVELLRQKKSTQRTWALVMGTIAGISLLVGGIGIMNIMLANVSDRRKEIGTRRALGARQKDILYQFLIEGATLTGLGGLAGVVVGYGISLGISHFSGWPTLVPRWAVLLSVSVSCGTGILFGFWPAYQAARVKPIEALRSQ